jgi:hypothetical protein
MSTRATTPSVHWSVAHAEQNRSEHLDVGSCVRARRPGRTNPASVLSACDVPRYTDCVGATADVYESEREIVIVIAMPGVRAERMQIDSEPGVLVVRGSRSFPLVGPGHAVRQLEIPHGNFERRISLPPGRLELGAPEVDQGCVVLRLRKLGWARP